MNHEQFVYWLNGLLKGMKFGNQKLPLSDLIEEELAKVMTRHEEYVNQKIKELI